MSLRTRLLAAFAYVLVLVIVALEVPLILNVSRRVDAEVKAQAAAQAQLVAASAAAELEDEDVRRLEDIAREATRESGGRVIVVGRDGRLVADSAGLESASYRDRPEIAAALDGRIAQGRRFSDTLGESLLYTAVPVVVGGDIGGAVRVTQSVDAIDRRVRRDVLGLVGIGAIALVLGLGFAWVLAGTLARPLQRLASAARRVEAGDLEARAEPEGSTEHREVAHAFNDMTERLGQVLEAQRQFVANASHQLRTPLTGMKLRLESAAAGAVDPTLAQEIRAADAEVDRLAGIVDRLLSIARDIEEGLEAHVDVADAISRAVDRWQDRAARADARLSAEGEHAVAFSDPRDLDQVLDVVLDNAIAYAPGPIEIRTGRSDSRVTLTIQDHGAGIDHEDLPRVTERFYRGRGAPPGGSGLGLAIAKELVEKWGGRLVVSDPEAGGARVEIALRPVDSFARS
jgi:two-component system, OmpR family, sensor kinase